MGGNKILLEADDTAISFDFGINYDVWLRYFEEYLKPRATRGLVDLFEIGLLSSLKGIYRAELELSWDNAGQGCVLILQRFIWMPFFFRTPTWSIVATVDRDY